jgi:hypothetical protein
MNEQELLYSDLSRKALKARTMAARGKRLFFKARRPWLCSFKDLERCRRGIGQVRQHQLRPIRFHFEVHSTALSTPT